ncbi:MAG: glycosyl transferase family 36 [Chloroflexi bacterium]|nr:glycosyl transferase family 36 [Chloroflexota bacterium]MCI0648448.1 glycosyl transferase family 36 [Chloroflexota bacterium]MCI0727584.1 glycosyl transferase family 36 [Chloroflexota bacterium]
MQNDYGYFSEDGKEYIITRPDTPMPWINVISNGDYGLVLSQAGSGYSWLTHASLNRITRWEQDLVRDDWGKYLYLRDADSHEFWSAGWQPCGGTLEFYQVRHGMGYSVVEARRGNLESQLTYLVPPDDPCELWLLRLQNRGRRLRKLQLFTYLEWLLGAAPDWHREFHRLFIEAWYDDTHGALLATKAMWDLPGQPGVHWNRSWPYVAFHSSSQPPAGFESDKGAFMGRNGRLSEPRALGDGRSLNTQGRWGDAIGSLQVNVTLPPGEAVELVFTLGVADDTEQALALAERYRQPAAAHQALAAVRRTWQEITGRIVVETPDPALNLMANGWLQYQAISGRLWGRTAYYQTGGAYGFRDQLQDSLVWLLLDRPEQTLAQIRLHAAHQFQDGVVFHWWHPLAEWGLRSKHSDDLLWLPFAAMCYLHETGSFDCLEEEIPFWDGGVATLREHCLRAFRVALQRRSERGLPLILEGDWNDGLNAVGPAGRGESIWMAHFLYYLLTGWASLPILNEADQARFRTEAEALREATNAHGWDGAWYWRATTDDGAILGSDQQPEGKIFLNAQTWAVLSGLAPADRAHQAMASAREHLYTAYGPLLFAPGYTRPDPKIGYLSRYAPGARENGGVYVHAACWAVLAERRLHGAEAAYATWRSFCPPWRGQEPEVYAAEPYVMPGNVSGPQSATPGRGGWTWYTGSAAWYLRAAIEGVLGVEARLLGLHVQADLPAGWKEFRLQRSFRGALYHIHVRQALEGEQPGCTVDGQACQTECLPVAAAGSVSVVEIVI